ncbi:MAG: dockerin type I repeat-containing protein [Ruminococcus sp.]|nr:dockerin type I repeat-containing protein [Ruminococcus sp.]
MKKALAILLASIILMSAIAITANAARPPQLYGDAYYDMDVNIMDATAIQQHLASITELEMNRYEAADVDGDSSITIMDATTIQQYLASIITEFPAGEYYLIDKCLYDVIPSYMSGKAQVGVAVDFTVDGYAYPNPEIRYLYVNDELVDTAVNEDETLTYTFPQVGVYTVKVVFTDKWGFEAGEWTKSYQVIDVIEDTTKPVITNIAIVEKFTDHPTVRVDVMYGTGDYSYSYIIKDEDGTVIYERRYLQSNTHTVEYGALDYFVPYTLTVEVMDSHMNFTTSSTTLMCEEIAPA